MMVKVIMPFNYVQYLYGADAIKNFLLKIDYENINHPMHPYFNQIEFYLGDIRVPLDMVIRLGGINE